MLDAPLDAPLLGSSRRSIGAARCGLALVCALTMALLGCRSALSLAAFVVSDDTGAGAAQGGADCERGASNDPNRT